MVHAFFFGYISFVNFKVLKKRLIAYFGIVDYLLSPVFFRSLFWFDLVTLTFHENSNHGRKNYWIFNWFINNKTVIKKWLKSKIPSFVWRIWKWKEKRTTNFWPSGAGIQTPDFSNFPAHDLNFDGRWGWQDQNKASF